MTEAIDIRSAVPVTLNHLVGQKRPVQQLRTAIEAVINDRAATPAGQQPPALGHILLAGPPGLGKTLLAGIVARELGSRCHEELAQNLLSPTAIQGLLLMISDYDVLFIDEIQDLPSVTQTTLYRCLEERRLFLPAGPGGERSALVLPPFTIIGATTDEHALTRALKDRFKIIIRMTFYSPTELQDLLLQRSRLLGWQVDVSALADLASKGRGCPRKAITLLEATRRVCRAEGADAITLEHVHKMMAIEGLDSMGLDECEQQYLRLLAASTEPIRLNVLATMMGLPRRTIEYLECDLMRMNYVVKEDEGRMISAKGRNHLNRSA